MTAKQLVIVDVTDATLRLRLECVKCHAAVSFTYESWPDASVQTVSTGCSTCGQSWPDAELGSMQDAVRRLSTALLDLRTAAEANKPARLQQLQFEVELP